MTLSKKFSYLTALILIVLNSQIVKAEKLTITKFDNYLNMSGHIFDPYGNKVFLDQFEGETILLVFWATWCGNCVHDLTSLDNLQKDFKKLPFKVIALSEDFQDIEIVQNHFERLKIRHLKVYHDRQNQIFKAFDIVGLPTAYLINASGKLKLSFKGSVKWHDNEIRTMILEEIEGVHELPKNTYKAQSLIGENELFDQSAQKMSDQIKSHENNLNENEREEK